MFVKRYIIANEACLFLADLRMERVLRRTRPFVGSLPGTAPDVKPNVFQHTAICFLNASCEHGEALVERYSNGLGRECHKDPGTKWQCIITIL
jgi:hypothetical protein